MNVQVPKRQLLDSLGHVERIIPSRSSNPSLSLLKLELTDSLTDSGLTFSGSNMDLDIESRLPADVKGTGTVAVPAQVFSQVVRALPGELVELDFSEREVEIRSGSYDTSLQLADAGGIPELRFPESYRGGFDGATLGRALAHVRYAAAVAEYQAIFRWVKLELADGRTRAVAIDGFRLAYYHLEDSSGLSGNLVIPARSVDELVKVLSGGEVALELMDGQLSLRSGQVKLNVKLMEGDFPDYSRVIPKQFALSLVMAAGALAEAVARVAVMADKTSNNRVDLFLKDGRLQITAEGAYGRSQESLEVVQEGDESQIAVAYNAKYLVDALAPMDGDLRLSLSGTTSPSVLASLAEPSYFAMVVPLRTG
ncbi:DNA polymerase III subunit beta [soil metagenome]